MFLPTTMPLPPPSMESPPRGGAPDYRTLWVYSFVCRPDKVDVRSQVTLNELIRTMFSSLVCGCLQQTGDSLQGLRVYYV